MKLEDIDFFISDLHFGHYGVIDYSNRPYKHWLRYLPFLKKNQYLYSIYKRKSVQKMEDDLIKKWNQVVKTNQRVLICGDFAYMPLKKMESLLKKINGKKVLIKGNHDDKSFQSYLDIGFEAVYSELDCMLEDIPIKFSHYPFVDLDLEHIASLRPNILHFNSTAPYRNIDEHNIKCKKDFLKKNYRTAININDEKTKKIMLQMQRQLIGTKPSRSGFVLGHGHTHSSIILKDNAINLCVEAIGYKPLSNKDFCELVKKAKKNVTEHIVISSLNSSLDTLNKEAEEIRRKIQICRNKFGDDILIKLHKSLNLIELYVNIIQEFPITEIPINISDEWIQLAIKYKKFIATEKLVAGGVYEGQSRNSTYALWDGKQWHAKRTKFGHTFLEHIDYIGSNSEYDLFIPYKQVFDQYVLDFFHEHLNS